MAEAVAEAVARRAGDREAARRASSPQAGSPRAPAEPLIALRPESAPPPPPSAARRAAGAEPAASKTAPPVGAEQGPARSSSLPMIDARPSSAKRTSLPKRSFGQNFLVAERIVRGIAEACVPAPRWARARPRARRGARGAHVGARRPRAHVTAVERDRDLVPILARALASAAAGKLTILEARRAGRDLAAVLGEPDARARASSAATSRTRLPAGSCSSRSRRAAHVDRVVFMVQDEVAERLVASPGHEGVRRAHRLRARRRST